MNQLSSYYGNGRLECLRENPEVTADYLNSALEEGLESFSLALNDVVSACGSQELFSQKTGLPCSILAQVFSEGENATIAGVSKVLKAFNLRIVITRE